MLDWCSAKRLFAVGGILFLGACDDITTGQVAEDPGAPKIVRIVVQDDGPFNGRGVASDLLDNLPAGQVLGYDGKPQTSCDDKNPCPAPVQCGAYFSEVFPASDPRAGQCHDPNNVNETAPPIGTMVQAGGSSIRVVFNKVLNPSIETVLVGTCLDANTAKGSSIPCAADGDCLTAGETCVKAVSAAKYGYKLGEGIISLQDPAGKTVKAKLYYDPIGSPLVTSNAITSPYGPALVIRPAAQLTVNTKYTIIIDGTKVIDHKKQAAADASGKALGAGYMVSFTTEGLFVMQDWNCPGGALTPTPCANAIGHTNFPDTSNVLDTTSAADIAPNDFIQLTTNADVNETTLDKIKLTDSSGKAVKIAAFNDRGADPTSCDMNLNLRSIDIVAVDDKGAPKDLAVGKYTLTVTGAKDNDTGLTSIADFTLNLNVTGAATDPKTDTFATANLVMPSQCVTAPTDDMPMTPVDMTAASGDMTKGLASDGGSPDLSKAATDGGMPNG